MRNAPDREDRMFIGAVGALLVCAFVVVVGAISAKGLGYDEFTATTVGVALTIGLGAALTFVVIAFICQYVYYDLPDDIEQWRGDTR